MGEAGGDNLVEDCRTDSPWSDPLELGPGWGWALFYVAGTLWLFLGIAHVAEEYFAVAISQIIVEYKVRVVPAEIRSQESMVRNKTDIVQRLW